MASGFGAMGGQGRCYEVWKDMVECRTSYATTAPEQSHCKDLLSDYRECLHHTKEVGYSAFLLSCSLAAGFPSRPSSSQPPASPPLPPAELSSPPRGSLFCLSLLLGAAHDGD